MWKRSQLTVNRKNVNPVTLFKISSGDNNKERKANSKFLFSEKHHGGLKQPVYIHSLFILFLEELIH